MCLWEYTDLSRLRRKYEFYANVNTQSDGHFSFSEIFPVKLLAFTLKI